MEQSKMIKFNGPAGFQFTEIFWAFSVFVCFVGYMAFSLLAAKYGDTLDATPQPTISTVSYGLLPTTMEQAQ